MFTGLIEEIGTVQTVEREEKGARIGIKANQILRDVQIGDSISTNGVCLTVSKVHASILYADVMAETIRRSNLGGLKTGSKVNLERALRMGNRLGGHVVTGHIDGTGTITSYEKEDNAVWISIHCSGDILKYIVEKGSVAVDGISLTVAYVDENYFKVSIIPHTGEETTLLDKEPGDKVNLECDIIGKYVEKLLGIKGLEKEKGKKSIDADFLKENGFM